jgi:hypothetical protein
MITNESPSIEFLIQAIVTSLLHDYGVERPPVPIRLMVTTPPPGVAGDIKLAESPNFTFCRAAWIRLLDGQGIIFLNSALSEPEQRFELAQALFAGLCASPSARASGLYGAVIAASPAQQLAYGQSFARQLLMPIPFLPTNWQQLTDQALAQYFVLPVPVVQAQRRELLLA